MRVAHQALYRVWRPQRFAELIGQEHVARTLRNALAGGRVSHAYLFSGPRGTGKTSAARILAKAVNCCQPVEQEPCDNCVSCQAIREGQALDVLEIDAASNRGIDEMRELREKVRFAPVQGRYRVYIIDEVHMLTTEAFNALLKTLEEPPAHVLFVLATTELYRLPATILSRCQRFDFRRISREDIRDRVRLVAGESGVEIEETALTKLVQAADGSLRDALALLDQCRALAGERITRQDLELVLGTVAEEYLADLTAGLETADAGRVLQLVDQIVAQGKEPRRLLQDLIGHVRGLLLAEVTAGELDRRGWLMNMWQQLAAVDGEMKWSLQPRWILEAVLLRIGEQPASIDPRLRELTTEVQRLQSLVAELRNQPAPPPDRKPLPAAAEPAVRSRSRRAESVPAAAPTQGDTNLTETGLSALRAQWPQVLDQVRRQQVSIHALLVEAEPAAWEQGVVTLSFKSGRTFHRQRLEESEGRRVVEAVLSEILGQAVSIHCVMQGEARPGSDGAEPSARPVAEHPLVQSAIAQFGEERVRIKKQEERQ